MAFGDDYAAIVVAAGEEQARLELGPPRTCPNDGTNLLRAPGGALRCPFDGWCWDGEPVTWE